MQYHIGVYTMKTRHVRTKSEGLLLQYQTITGSWRDIKFLNSDLRKTEKEMNKLLDKFGKLAEKRADYLEVIEDAEKDIKSGGCALYNTGSIKVEAIGFTKWMNSFTCVPLFPKQKDTWKSVVDLLRKNSFVKVSASQTTLLMTNLTSRTISPTQQKDGGG